MAPRGHEPDAGGGTRPLRVVFVSHLSGHYGAERVLLEVLAGLSARRVDCRVLRPAGGTLGPYLEALKIPQEPAPIRWWASEGPPWKRPLRILANLTAAVSVARRLSRWPVDVVYSNSSVSPTGALAAWLLRKPHVWHVHEFAEEDHGLSFDLGPRLTYVLIGRLSRCVITNSDAVKAKCARYIPGERIRTVYAAVSRAPEERIRPAGCLGRPGGTGRATVVLIGKIKESKGQMEAVHATEELVREGVALELVLAGSADERYLAALRQVVAAAGLDAHVRFLGHVSDIGGVLESADAVLVCSRSEAFGMVTVEAMRFGKPVVGARSGATVELIREGFNGLLYTPGDVHELAGKLGYLIRHPDSAAQMGENGRRWAAERFSSERLADEVLTVIQEAALPPLPGGRWLAAGGVTWWKRRRGT